MPASRDVADKEIKILWALAAGRCAFPQCRTLCVAEASTVDPAVPLGEMAHIVAHSDAGPRADASFPRARRNTYGNLLLLCPTHHTLVDKQESTFTITDLATWKREHEAWVRQRLAEEFPSVGFTELEMVTRGLLAGRGDASQDLTLTAPGEKMTRNSLTTQVLMLVQMGVAGAGEVRSFVSELARLDPDFPERLKAGFVNLYRELRSLGNEGDTLFLALSERVAGASGDFRLRMAGLAVIGYLFLTCELFEP